MSIRIGIGPIGWANDDLRGWGPERTGDDIMREIAEAGYEGSEMSYTYPQAPSAVKAALSRHGLVLASAYRWTNFAYAEHRQAEMEAARKHVDFCADAGARHVLLAEGSKSLHWDLGGARSHVAAYTDDEWKRVHECFNEIGLYAKGRNLQLCIHPHAGTAIETREAIDRLFKGTDPELVAYCLDTGHAFYGGTNPIDLIEAWAPRIRYVHVKDVRGPVLEGVRQQKKTFLEAIQSDVFGTPGEGQLDFGTILGALLRHRYEGWLVVEADQNPGTHHPLTVARSARQLLGRWLGQTAAAS